MRLTGHRASKTLFRGDVWAVAYTRPAKAFVRSVLHNVKPASLAITFSIQPQHPLEEKSQ